MNITEGATATASQHVVVVGGGYGGVTAANRLTSHDGVEVTLVNPRPDFVERIRLHQVAAGSGEATHDFREVLHADVRLVVATVSRIEPSERQVRLADGAILAYDQLVYAVGSLAADRAVPGAAEHAYPLADLDQARRLRGILARTASDAPVVVVGAGPTGIETAAELAERGHVVTLVAGGPVGPYLHPRARRSVTEQLTRLGVRVLDGPGTTVVQVSADSVRLADGRELPSTVTVWTAGFVVPDLARRSGLSTDPVGRLLTDETLTSIDDDRIVAAGDSAAPSGLAYRMSCQAAIPLGAQAADTVLRRIAGRQPEAASIGFVGQCLSLGRHAGVVQPANRDDVAYPVHVSGRLAALIKETVCRQTVAGLAREARRPGSTMVLRNRRRREAALQQRVEARPGVATTSR